MHRPVIALAIGSMIVAALAAAPTPAGDSAKPSLTDPASIAATAPDKYYAHFETTAGDFWIEVDRAWSPHGADRFYGLVADGFYDGCKFFRVLPGFVVQWGMNGNPAVTAAWRQATIPDDPVVQGNEAGTIAFAKPNAPNSRTTQVFVNLGDNGNLDRMGFPAFGRVVRGMDVVRKLYSGYGEGAPGGRGPNQARIAADGNAYLDAQFPKLDAIKKATIATALPEVKD